MLIDVGRHARLRDRFGQLGDLLQALAVLAQLLADLAHLLAQQDLLLPVVERLLGLLLDLPRELEHLDAAREQGRDAFQAVAQLGRLQELLFVGGLDVEEARDHVGEHRRGFDGLDAVGELGGRLWQQRDRFHRLLLQVQRSRLDIGIGCARLGKELDPRDEERKTAHLVEHAKAALALADEMMRPVGSGQVTHYGSCRPHAMQVVETGILGVGLLLQQEADLGFGSHGLLRAGHRLLRA